MPRLPLIVAALLCTTAIASAEEKRELGAHEHGHVELSVAIDGSRVEMELEAPAEDIVGFEHEPSTDEQRAAIEKAEATMADPMALFTMPEAAGCTVASNKVEMHREADHAAFEAAYALDCTDIAKLDRIETKLFALYPSIEEIEVEYATPAGQGKGELEADAPALTLPTS